MAYNINFILAFLGDNLASNAVGGFKESFSATYRCCRTCLATNSSRKEIFYSNMFQLRSDDAHLQYCNDLNGPLKDHISTTYGINRRSVLLDAPHYSMFNGGLPHDIMHDFFEGIAQYHIKLLLKSLVGRKCISLDELNDRLVHFDYGYSETDRPRPVLQRTLNSSDSKVRLSASQCMLFCRMFPLLVGDKVSEDDSSWKCYLAFLDILDIVVCPIISEGLCGHLKLLIKQYLATFKATYPGASIIPKMHFLTHYPEQIMAIGPPIRAWTMRYEAKLNLFKRASHLGNFKNIALTLSHRHQRWLCYQLSSGELFRGKFECGPVSECHPLSSMTENFNECMNQILPNISGDTLISHSTWIKLNGITYKSSNCYVVTGSDGSVPTFARVVGTDLPVLQLQSCQVSYYDEHYHSYVINETSHLFLSLVDAVSNISQNVLHSRKMHGNVFLTLKHYIFV